MEIKDFQVGDFVKLKKSHPSKTEEWKIVKIGARIKLQSTLRQDLIIELNPTNFLKVVK